MTPVSAPRRRRHEEVGRGPIIGSVLIHCLAIGLAWWTTAIERDVPNFIVYEIELVSPPAAELGDPNPPPPEELVIETPEEVFPEPQEEEEPPVIEDDPPPREDPKPEEMVAPPEPDEEDPAPATSPDPDPEVETPGEDLNVRMEGVRRDYPEYYNNIIRQMQRCFRWRGADVYSASIYFVINRDGTVSGIDVLVSSKNTPFDIEAMGAAECAGNRGRLGPLPEELPFEQLPVRFEFGPKSGQDDKDIEEAMVEDDGATGLSRRLGARYDGPRTTT